MTSPAERETSRKAILAFVWAMFGAFGLFLIGPVVALGYSRSAKRMILAEPQRLKGRELTEAARSVATCFLMIHVAMLVVAGALGAMVLATRR